MKSFKEYLIESKQTYEFKIKIAGDHESCAEKIKHALAQYEVESVSDVKRTPIQETHVDFPEHTNTNVTICDIVCGYPVTSLQVRNLVAEALNLTHMCVKVRNLKEQEEDAINHQFDEKSGKALLGADYEKENNQDLVGEKQKMKLLKELNKTKHTGEQYKGVNDKLLAKKAPIEKGPAAKNFESASKSVSPVGSKQVKLPQAKTAGGQ